MCGHETGSDNRLSITHGWIDCGYCKDPLLKEALGKGKSLGLAANKDGHNRALGRADLESDRLEPLVHLAGVPPEQLDALGLGLHDLEGLEDTADDGRRQGSREDEAAGLVLHELDHLVGAGNKSAHGTE